MKKVKQGEITGNRYYEWAKERVDENEEIGNPAYLEFLEIFRSEVPRMQVDALVTACLRDDIVKLSIALQE